MKIAFLILRCLCLLSTLLCVATSCSKRSSEAEPEPVAIRLYTRIQTRGTVEDFNGTALCVAYGTSPDSYTECWDGIATGNEIMLTPMRHYPLDGSPVYLRSFYPPAPMQQDGTLNYTLTGEEDLMMTTGQSATQNQPFSDTPEKIFTHRHLLTKLDFNLKLETSAPDLYRIHSLRLNGLARQVKLCLLTERLECGEQTVPVTIFDASSDGSTFPFVDGTASLPGYVLVQPDAEFTLDLSLAVDDQPANLEYTKLPIRFEEGSGEAGIAYTVLVEIPDPEATQPGTVHATATITSWKDGGNGNGELVTDKK